MPPKHRGTPLNTAPLAAARPGPPTRSLSLLSGAFAIFNGMRIVVAYAPDSTIATPLLTKGSGWDWLQDLAPLGKVGRVPFVLAVHPGVPAQTVADRPRSPR